MVGIFGRAAPLTAVVCLGMMLSGAAGQADDVPSVSTRDDYVSTLMFADILPEAIKWNGGRANTVCLVIAPKPDSHDLEDASEQAVSALRAKFAIAYPNLAFLRKSQCGKSHNGDILYLISNRNGDPATQPMCGGQHDGEYQASYSAGGWGGNGYSYNLSKDGDALTLQRTPCMISGVLYAP